MHVTILGCGEAFDEFLPNTSLLLEWDSMTLLLDCGYSAPPQVWRAVSDVSQIDAVWVSHAHADHYFGLPALCGRMCEEGRTKPLAILGRQDALDSVSQSIELGYRGLTSSFRYPIEYRAARPGDAAGFASATLRFAQTAHSVPNLAVRVEAAGAVFCYSGDGMFTAASRDLFSDADMLIHEAFSFDRNPAHADIPRLIDMADAQRVGHLSMVHVQRMCRRKPDRIRELIEGRKHWLSLPEPMTGMEVGRG